MPRIEKGIRLHMGRLEANVTVNRQKYWRRFPKDATVQQAQEWRTLKQLALTSPNPAMCTALAELERQLNDQRTAGIYRPPWLAHDQSRVPAAEQAGSLFRHDVQTYIALKSNLVTIQDREYHMKLWTVEFGERDRNTITPLEVRLVLTRWQKSGHADPNIKRLSNGSLNKRRTALLDFYTTLAGKNGYNPVRDVPIYEEDKTTPLRLPTNEEATRAVDGVVHPKYPKKTATLTQIRLRLMQHTGGPGAIIKRLDNKDIDWLTSHVTVHGRKKGGGTRPRTVPVNADALAALRQFDEQKAYGEFSNSSLYKALQRSCERLEIPFFNPYKLRHLFITTIVK